MLGWEFPPHISGGLGTACYGMTRGLDELGVDVCFVLPTAVPSGGGGHVQVRSPSDVPAKTALVTDEVSHVFEHVELHQVDAVLRPYDRPELQERVVQQQIERQLRRQRTEEVAAPETGHQQVMQALDAGKPKSVVQGGAGAHYSGDLMHQVQRYARLAVEISRGEAFDVIHAHDWMTYPAGMAVAAASGRPLVVHVHSTEFDRSGDNVNQQVYEIERTGMHVATRIVAVSHLTRSICVNRYGVSPDKIDVVYNATEHLPGNGEQWQLKPIGRDEKIVLFLGRVTMQKGPEYFLQAARKVADKFPAVRFIMAGSGDMMTRCIQLVADLKLGSHVTFTGFLRGADVDRVFRMADLYVMPSVSEPFGIAPLEALSRNVPVIISKQSGVSEVLTHVLKVDFWDVEEMANKILAVLKHSALQSTLRQHGAIELRKLSWVDSAKQLQKVYDTVVTG